MAGADALSAPSTPAASQLGSRIIVGVCLAAIAVADIWIGGPAFALMVAVFVCLVFWEWGTMHGLPAHLRWLGVCILLAASALTALDKPVSGLTLLLGATGAFLILSAMAKLPGKRWISTGLLYAGLPAVALIWLRGQPDGFALVMWTMAIVWATDVAAYFAGRAIGGPKLWPAISPNKTWAGLVGGATAAGIFSALFGSFVGWAQSPILLFAMGAALACVAQAGDFFESWLKRRAGVKDSGSLLRAHGGIMDRVDGLVPVACVVGLWVALT